MGDPIQRTTEEVKCPIWDISFGSFRPRRSDRSPDSLSSISAVLISLQWGLT